MISGGVLTPQLVAVTSTTNEVGDALDFFFILAPPNSSLSSCTYFSYTSEMASVFRPAVKRVRLATLTTPKPWICERCMQKRGFASAGYTKQQQQQQPNPTKPIEDSQTTHFGFSSVAESLKESKGEQD